MDSGGNSDFQSVSKTPVIATVIYNKKVFQKRPFLKQVIELKNYEQNELICGADVFYDRRVHHGCRTADSIECFKRMRQSTNGERKTRAEIKRLLCA